MDGSSTSMSAHPKTLLDSSNRACNSSRFHCQLQPEHGPNSRESDQACSVGSSSSWPHCSQPSSCRNSTNTFQTPHMGTRHGATNTVFKQQPPSPRSATSFARQPPEHQTPGMPASRCKGLEQAHQQHNFRLGLQEQNSDLSRLQLST